MRKKFFSLLVLLAAVVTSAMAQEESLLTTLTFGESETYGETTSGVVNVTATNVGSYNGTYGWLLDEGGSLSVTAKEGYTITKCVFRQNAKTPITDTEAPFEIHANDWGGIIEDPYEEMNGVTSIEVYGYANAGGGSTTTEVTITNSDFPEMDVTFTKDGVTVWADWIDNMNSGNLVGPGSFSTTLGNFTKIEVNAGEVWSLGEGWSGNSERQTWTGNASSVSFSGEIYGVGHGITLKFTIAESTVAVTGVTLNQSEAQMTVGGETLTLTATVNPNNATDQSVSWSTSDANVATVENGVVTAVAAGNATITVITTDGSFTATCAVTVTAPEPQGETITVTWNSYDLPSSGSSFTKDGVTVTCDIDDSDLYGPGTFTTDLGNFTQIVVSAYDACYIEATGGWSGNTDQMTWTGNAASVSWDGSIYGFSGDVTIVFTIEPASTPEPQPAEVTVVFAANDKTAERTVTLPHTFKCDWAGGMERPDELDIIIHELYNDYYYCNSNMNTSGSDQVEAGTEEDPQNDYITIKGVFEGTATVTGDYLDYIAGDYGEHNYSITISIKGDEPQPTGVENVQTNPVQATKFFRDGQLLIEKNGKLYNVMGAQVR